MKIIRLLAFFCCIQIGVNAQKTAGNIIKGWVTDSLQNTALEYATITLGTKGSKKPLNGAVTDKNGNFLILKSQMGSMS